MKVYEIKSIKTNNFNDDVVKIMNLWQEVLMNYEDYDGNWYGIYHEYESNFKGDYTLSICNEGISNSEEEIIIDKDNKYKIFEVSSNNDISKVWQEIWDLEEKGLLKRAYTIDYEKYSKDEITIHIALK